MGEPTDDELAATMCNAWFGEAKAWARADFFDRAAWLEVAGAARAALATPEPPTLPLHSRREQQVYRGGWVAGFDSRQHGGRRTG
jgi:hypothetical protein